MSRFMPVAGFLGCLVLTVALTAIVVLAPRYKTTESGLALRLYAEDEAVRKVTLASAAGLAATAFIFFRPAGLRFGRTMTIEELNAEVTDQAST